MHLDIRAQPIANTEDCVPQTLYWAKLKETGETCQCGWSEAEVHAGDLLGRSLGVCAVLTGSITLWPREEQTVWHEG
jgi:hypothetical protein